MKAFATENIRNLAVIGHGDAGKTQLVSSLLHVAGSATHRWGKVDEGTTITDYDEDSIERKVSLNNNFAHAEYKDTKINFIDTPKVIISASGMCDAGRIRHHLKHNLWREECTVLFVGYQSVGTLGRNILEGAQEVKLFGEAVDVRAEIRALQGMSGHADKNGLIAWLNCFEKKPERVFIVHGEDTVCTSFAECLRHEYGYHTYAPFSGTRFDLLHNLLEYEAAPIAREKKAKAAVANSVYARLEAAGQRLLAVIRNGKGMANKDMAKLADQINALCDKWQ